MPALGPSWQPALRGLDTRLRPGQCCARSPSTTAPRPSRTDLVHVHLGHALLQKSARILRSALFSADVGGAPRDRGRRRRTCRSRVSPRCPGWSWSAAAGSGCTRRCSSPASGSAARRWPRPRWRSCSTRRPRRRRPDASQTGACGPALAEAWNARRLAAAQPAARRDDAPGRRAPAIRSPTRCSTAQRRRRRPGPGDLRRVPRAT